MRASILLLAAAALVAAAPASADTLPIGYVELQDDPRYDRGRIQSRVPGQPWGRPFTGAEVAAQEARFPLSTVAVEIALRRETVSGRDGLDALLDRFAREGVQLIMLDLPADLVSAAVEATAGNGQKLFNVSASDNELRAKQCSRDLFHLAASDAIRMGGLAQYLVERRWKQVLILEGPQEADARRADAFRAAAERYGLEIVETRKFVRGHNPRQRKANNLDLLTRGTHFDVIYVADDRGDFARTVPYHTRAPRPVVGSAGLVPGWWHWNWQNHGARQLNNRFERHAERRMTSYDWSAWIGVKAIAEAVVRSGKTNPEAIAGYLRGDDLVLDGFQGYRLSFRPWNNQLRTAMFLASPNWVVARAPFKGFLHPRNDLDSLGRAKGESQCAI